METTPIRAARRADVPSLVLLWTAMLEESARHDPRLALHPDARESAVRDLSARVDDGRHVVLVVEEAGRLVVGFAAGHVTAGHPIQGPARIGQVTDCFVAPARRRHGTGRRLATRLLDLLTERGADVVRLQVVARNEASQAFWASLGYEPLEEILERPPLVGPQ